MVRADELIWQPVPSLPKGAQMAIIEGPLNEVVYRVPAHWHPALKRVTVLSGEFWMGLVDKVDESASHPLRAGDVMLTQPKTPHFAWTKVPTEIQLHSTRQSSIKYLNPAEDPRKQ